MFYLTLSLAAGGTHAADGSGTEFVAEAAASQAGRADGGGAQAIGDSWHYLDPRLHDAAAIRSALCNGALDVEVELDVTLTEVDAAGTAGTCQLVASGSALRHAVVRWNPSAETESEAIHAALVGARAFGSFDHLTDSDIDEDTTYELAGSTCPAAPQPFLVVVAWSGGAIVSCDAGTVPGESASVELEVTRVGWSY